MASSLGFWWFCNFWVQNLILAMAFVEVYHDLQYIGFVWEYNTKHIAKHAANVSGWLRQLFRQKGWLVVVYLVLVFFYGFFGEFNRMIASPNLTFWFTVLIGTSTLAHFYFDGFIWKLKDHKVRDGFNVDNRSPQGSKSRLIRGISHDHLFLVVLVILVGAVYGQYHHTKNPITHLGLVANFLPSGKEAHLRFGVALTRAGHSEAAEHAFAAVQRNEPGFKDVRVWRAVNLLSLKQFDRAENLLKEELARKPNFFAAKRELALLYFRSEQLSEAQELFSELERKQPEDPAVNFHMGLLALREQQVPDAIARFRRALATDPHYRPARIELQELGQL